ncbi:GNAT family N-acetyltransferase [Lentilactobacillus sp. Marseille-Q4993]|uniref:GNAT family N-acetyltransferase n=1 Tax=Lentilactobacillus sp. Marseille-Q4993 TaxID=3039492 RepID=UPI0024BD1226|nr:GNAT family N-acetyltransferase [Lentilactobacillus sp. Marseille-Q4993]
MIINANAKISSSQLIDIFESSGIHRPINDSLRMQRMLNNANIIYTAWIDDQVIGVARGFSDFSYCCFISDLAVKREYQHDGVGRALINKIRTDLGKNISLVLLAAPSAINYYPKIGFESVTDAFKIQRKV